MWKTLLLVFVTSSILLSQNINSKDHTKYFPLTVGSEWEYVWEIENENFYTWNTYVSSSNYKDYELITRTFYHELQLPLLIERYTHKNSKILRTGRRYSDGFETYFSCPIELVLPLKVGLKWEYETDQGEKFCYKVIKWHDSVSTNFGTYKDVFEVEEIMPGIELSLKFKYYAYGVGLILEEKEGIKKGSRQVVKVLKSYTIK